MRHQLSLTRMAVKGKKKGNNNKCCWGETGPSNTDGGNVKQYRAPLWRAVPQKVKHGVTTWPDSCILTYKTCSHKN